MSMKIMWEEIPEFLYESVADFFAPAVTDVTELVNLTPDLETLALFLTDYADVWTNDESEYYNAGTTFMKGCIKFCMIRSKLSVKADRKEWKNFRKHLSGLYKTVKIAHKEANKEGGKLGLREKYIYKRG